MNTMQHYSSNTPVDIWGETWTISSRYSVTFKDDDYHQPDTQYFRGLTVAQAGGLLNEPFGCPFQSLRSETCGMEVWVDYHCTPGQYLVLTGGMPALGNWDPSLGVEAQEKYPTGSGRWKASFAAEKMQYIEWKWVVVEGPDRKVIRWQESRNHNMYNGLQDHIEVEASWDGHCFVSDYNFRMRPPCEDNEREIITVLENLKDKEDNEPPVVTEETLQRRLEEMQAPRHVVTKEMWGRKEEMHGRIVTGGWRRVEEKLGLRLEEAFLSGSNCVVTKKQLYTRLLVAIRQFKDTHKRTRNVTNGTQEADDVFSLPRWMFQVITMYLGLSVG